MLARSECSPAGSLFECLRTWPVLSLRYRRPGSSTVPGARGDCHNLPLYLPCPQLVGVFLLPPGSSRRESELTSHGWFLGPQWRVQPGCPIPQSL